MNVARLSIALAMAVCLSPAGAADQRAKPGTRAGIIVIGGNPAAPPSAAAHANTLSIYSPARAREAGDWLSLRNAENARAQQVRSQTRPTGTALPQGSMYGRAPAPPGQSPAMAASPDTALSRAPTLAGTGTRVVQDRSDAAKYQALPAEIWMVNGKRQDFLVTPGGYLTISGKGFGATIGTANVIGAFPGGAVPLRVIDWRDDEVYALLPEGLRGVLDQRVNIQLITRTNVTQRIDGGRFVAAREEIVLTQNLRRLVSADTAGVWPAEMNADAAVIRSRRFGAVHCPYPDTDYLIFARPANQHQIVGVTMKAVDPTPMPQEPFSGFVPGYEFGEWSDRLPVKWGVWETTVTLTGSDWECDSGYRVDSITTFGPAGVSPL